MSTPITASDGGGDPPPNGGLMLPIQPPLVQTNFNHSINKKLDGVNYLF